MKYLKTYLESLNESIRDEMKPKSKEEVLKNFMNADKTAIEETIYDDCIEYFDGDQDKFIKFVEVKLGIDIWSRFPNRMEDDILISDVLESMTKEELLKMFKLMFYDEANESVNESVENNEIKKYNHMIDYTQLDPAATEEDIFELTEKAKIIKPASICILPKMVRFGKENLKGTDIMVCTVISFPGGNNPLESKLAETKQAIVDGADEIDMVLDYKKIIKNWDGDSVDDETKEYLLEDVTQLAEECHKNNITLKVIVESGLLDVEQVRFCTDLCLECGADFIKTSTGKVAIGAELDKVKMMKDTIAEFGGTMFIKASGGIRTIDDIKKFYPFVDRFGVGWGAVDTMNGIGGEIKNNY